LLNINLKQHKDNSQLLKIYIAWAQVSSLSEQTNMKDEIAWFKTYFHISLGLGDNEPVDVPTATSG
jgi:hypothetical protein